jgi:hypothetical protein
MIVKEETGRSEQSWEGASSSQQQDLVVDWTWVVREWQCHR